MTCILKSIHRLKCKWNRKQNRNRKYGKSMNLLTKVNELCSDQRIFQKIRVKEKKTQEIRSK